MGKDLKTILAPLGGHLEDVDREIERALKTGVPIIDASSLHLFLSGGKRIRASLVILTSGLTSALPEGIIRLAAATEIVHAASLIHDDIIDQSMFRRGNVTVPHKWGNKVSVLAGDFMYSVALNLAISDGNPAIFPLMVNGTKDMVMGELCQLEYADIDSASRKNYLTIIELKTARFMGSCAKLGATKSGLGAEETEQLYRFGLNLGFAFQIIDDTLDIMQNADHIGKDAGNDFKDGKITLPFLYLIEKEGSGALQMLKQYIDNPDTDLWQKIVKRLDASGAIDYSVRFAGEYIGGARGILEQFPDSPYRTILFELSDFLQSRTY
ncbi:MAG: polyprenyl synthetase family protein [Spirochaetes bacterium]|nr:polyprenyl synthetase family protein [Spirochaetota bacterium]